MKRTLTTFGIMVMVLVCGYFVSACKCAEINEVAVSDTLFIDEFTRCGASTKESEQPHTVPEIIPVDTEEKVLLDYILDEPYDVWLPGRLPQTMWLRNGEGAESTFVIDNNTAVINHGVVSCGDPNEDGTIYILCNLADAPAIREVCFNAELKGATRAVVCNIAVSRIAFENFVERRIKA